MTVDLSNYNDVAARIAEFRAKHPEGSLQPADPGEPYDVATIGEQTFVVVVAAAYRDQNDLRPGIGMAYEPFPGRTPYTKGSELQNAETSAWGRAIVATLAADTKKGVASADEVRNRTAERDTEPDPKIALRSEIGDWVEHNGEDMARVKEHFKWLHGTTPGLADEASLREFLEQVREHGIPAPQEQS